MVLHHERCGSHLCPCQQGLDREPGLPSNETVVRGPNTRWVNVREGQAGTGDFHRHGLVMSSPCLDSLDSTPTNPNEVLLPSPLVWGVGRPDGQLRLIITSVNEANTLSRCQWQPRVQLELPLQPWMMRFF